MVTAKLLERLPSGHARDPEAGMALESPLDLGNSGIGPAHGDVQVREPNADHRRQRIDLERASSLDQRLVEASEGREEERIPVVTGGVVGIELEGAAKRRLGVSPAPFVKGQGHRKTEMRLGQTAVEQQRLFGGRALGRSRLPRRGKAEVGERRVGVRDPRVGERVARVAGRGPLERRDRVTQIAARPPIEVQPSPQEPLIRLEALRHVAGERRALSPAHRNVERRADPLGDLRFQPHQIADGHIDDIFPERALAVGGHNTQRDRKLLPCSRGDPAQSCVYPQLATECARIGGGARRPRFDGEGLQATESPADRRRQLASQIRVHPLGSHLEGLHRERPHERRARWSRESGREQPGGEKRRGHNRE